MRKILLSFLFIACGIIAINAQVTDTINVQPTDTLITFETSADTTGWEVFANGANPAADDVIVVANPDSSEINPSDSVLHFQVNDDANPWAGIVLRDVFVGESALAITEENHIFTMQVHRPTVGNVGLKLENEIAGGDDVEVIVLDTVINEWAVISFDFTAAIGNIYETIVIFPDFPDTDRTVGTVVYIDNIMFGVGETTSSPLVEKLALKVYPNPAHNRLHVQHPEMTGYTISNSLGQIIEKMNFGPTNQRTIDVGKLVNGIHFITIESKNGIHTSRFIKN